jgi:hypothetical protein
MQLKGVPLVILIFLKNVCNSLDIYPRGMQKFLMSIFLQAASCEDIFYSSFIIETENTSTSERKPDKLPGESSVCQYDLFLQEYEYSSLSLLEV